MTPDGWNKLAQAIGYTTEEQLLREWYLHDMMSVNNIAARLGVGNATIIRRLDYYKIQRRERGGANNSSGIRLKLHYTDQRAIFASEVRGRLLLARLNIAPSTLYKYKRGVTL